MEGFNKNMKIKIECLLFISYITNNISKHFLHIDEAKIEMMKNNEFY